MNEEDFDPIAQEERELLGIIADLQREYQRQAKPYVDRLVRLKSLQPPPPFIFPVAEADAETMRKLLPPSLLTIG